MIQLVEDWRERGKGKERERESTGPERERERGGKQREKGVTVGSITDVFGLRKLVEVVPFS